jgi:hypothetical protein
MADEQPTTPPTPAPTPPAIDTRTAWQRWRPFVMLLLPLVTAALGALATHYGVNPRVVEIFKEGEKVLIAIQQPAPAGGGGDDFIPTMGWLRDEAEVERNLDEEKTLQFGSTPAGKAALGDEDVFLWRALRKAAGLSDKQYTNVNQQSVGCCVGCGFKHCADVVQATAIAHGFQFEFKQVSVEAIYAGSRVDVGGGRISGDGSSGSWAKEYVQNKGGIAAMQKYASADLTTFSPTRARAWGKSGAPADVKAASKEHPVKGCALVKSWADVKRAVQQGYPVAVCSDQGFTMQRDAHGRCRPQGTWAHCMAIIGVRSATPGVAEGGFILNSWGDNAHTGPVWPADMPVAGFWADAKVIEGMVRQGDSFALADVVGFPARRVPLDWNVRAAPKRPLVDVFARRDVGYSLAW